MCCTLLAPTSHLISTTTSYAKNASSSSLQKLRVRCAPNFLHTAHQPCILTCSAPVFPNDYLATPMPPVSNSRPREAPWAVAHSQACTVTSHATLKMTDRCCRTYGIIQDKCCVRKSLHGIRTSTSFPDVDVRVLCERVRVFVSAPCMFCTDNCAWCGVVSRC